MQVFFAYFLYLYYYMQYISKYKQFSFSFFSKSFLVLLTFYSTRFNYHSAASREISANSSSIMFWSLPNTCSPRKRDYWQKDELLGTHNQRAYLRKMAVDGYVVRVDMTDVKELAALLRTCSNNLNQIARRVNSTGNLYEEDIADLKTRYGELWGAFSSLLSKFEDL